MSEVEFIYEVDLGVAGDVNVNVEVDLKDVLEQEEIYDALNDPLVMLINDLGSEMSLLEYITYDSIADFVMENESLLNKVVSLLEEKYT